MPIEVKQASLSNGLHVMAEIDPDASTAAIGFFVKTGARDEAPALMGVSHFLEHMMFKGTATRTAEQVDQEFDDIGAEHNAFTTSELTAFWAHLLPEHLPKAQEVLSDILRPALRDVDFENEKKVILEEIAMYEDYPFWVLYERVMEEFYRGHALAHRVLGTSQTITALTRNQIAEYFNNRYSADNTVVVAAGRLDFDAMVQQLESQCCGWEATQPKRSRAAARIEPHEFAMTSDSVKQHYMLMVCPAPPVADDRRYAASILTQILGDSDGSRLYWALIETGLADEAQAQYEGRDGLGEFLVYASCSPSNASAVQHAATREMNALIGSLTEDDLERVKNKIATAVTLHGELPAGRMRRLGRLWCYLGEHRSLERELARLNSVTLDDLRSVHEAFPIRPIVTGHMMPALS